jgi:hypothetical protein
LLNKNSMSMKIKSIMKVASNPKLKLLNKEQLPHLKETARVLKNLRNKRSKSKLLNKKYPSHLYMNKRARIVLKET